MTRDTMRAHRARARDTERMVDAAVAEVKADTTARYQALAEQATARLADLPPFTAADLTTATHVRTLRQGWREVVKVNAKTVTIKLGSSWYRIPLHRVEAWINRNELPA